MGGNTEHEGAAKSVLKGMETYKKLESRGLCLLKPSPSSAHTAFRSAR